jgi:hypothetical protein
MSKRPTAYELGQEYAKLEKAHAGELAANQKAKDLALLMAEMFREFGTDLAESLFAEAFFAYEELRVKEKALKAELDRVKKSAWKWYGVAI